MFLYSIVQYGYWGKVETSALASEPSAHEGAHRASFELTDVPQSLGSGVSSKQVLSPLGGGPHTE